MKRRGIIFPSLHHEPAFIFRLDTLSIGIKTCIDLYARYANVYLHWFYVSYKHDIYMYVYANAVYVQSAYAMYINVGGLCGFILCGYGTGVPISKPIPLRIGAVML